MTKTIGITGGIGAGKSIVSKIIESLGFPVFNSDTEAKRIIAVHPDVKNGLIQLFGDEVYVDGVLNRVFLASHIFSNEELKNQVNQLIHPVVREAFNQFSQTSTSALVFNEAAILYETGSYRHFDKTILVTAPKELRIQRVMERDGVSQEKVLDRMRNQWEDEKKIPLADYILLNDGTEPLLQQVEQLIHDLLNQSPHNQ